MKKILRIPLLILLTLVILSLTACSSVPNLGPGLVLGQSYRLGNGETLNESLTVIGGNAVLDTGSTVNGDVAVIGGNVTIDGAVNGELAVMGGYVYLSDHAVIKGSVTTIGGSVQRSSKAVVEGQNTQSGRTPITTINTPGVNVSFDPITAPLTATFEALALAALAIIINLFASRPMERTGQAAESQVLASGGVGCLTILVLVIMTITIILIPISVLGFLAAAVAALFGWTALGLLLGRRLSSWLKQSWSEPINAGVGTLILSLVASLINFIPCIGWIGSVVVSMIGLGAVVLTRFGTQVYPTPGGAAVLTPRPMPYAPPAPVPPPAPTISELRPPEPPVTPPPPGSEPPPQA